MNNQTKITLIQYTTAAAAFIAVQASSFAQVIYTDLDPDLIIGGEGAIDSIDINEDGVNDFRFFVETGAGSYSVYGIPLTYDFRIVRFQALNTNSFVGKQNVVSSNTFNSVSRIGTGDDINNYNAFIAGTATVAGSININGSPYYAGGPWLGVNDSIFGVKLVVEDITYYGWVRLSISDDAGTITIHDFAYESTANKTIYAGAVVTSVPGFNEQLFSLYSFNSDIFVHANQNAKYTVIDLLGHQVANGQIYSGNNQINCSNLSTGSYIVKIENKYGLLSKTVFLSK